MSIWYLIRKDLLVSSRFLWFVGPLYVLHSISLSVFHEWGVLLIAVFSLFLAIGFLLFDVKYPLDDYMASLPLKRSLIVQARYVSAGIGLLVGLGFAFLCTRLISLFAQFQNPKPIGILSPVLLLLIFIVCCWLIATFLPFYFRWGICRGAIVFSLIAMGIVLLITILRVIWRWAYSTSGISIYPGKYLSPEILLPVVENWLQYGGGSQTLLIGILIITTMMVTISLTLSCHFFENRDL